MHRRSPLGISDEPPPPDGVACLAGSRVPGPVGTATDRVADVQPDRSAVIVDAPIGGSISLTFALGADSYRLRQVASDLGTHFDEEAISPEMAVVIIERVASSRRGDARLLSLLETAAAQLAGLHEGGTFLLLRKRPQPARAAAETPAPAPAAPISRPERLPELPIEVEEPVFAITQAVTLKTAAALGVPFCEECARAAAERAAAMA